MPSLDLKKQFETVFGQPATTEAKSFGRVNLIGEHTDYNEGFVFPTCIPQATRVLLRKREDSKVRLSSCNLAESKKGGPSQYELGKEKATHEWTDYIQGVTFILAREHREISGFDCLVDSNVPIGSGLSSSAALEVAVFKGLSELFHLELDPITIAKWGQRVENEFVGARVGIMDQMITSLGHYGEAVFIDTRDLSYRPVQIPTRDMDLLVINSGVTHDHAAGDYNARRSECEQACEQLGIKSLRELSMGDLPRLDKLPDTLKRRARHVITENDRVLKAVKALEAKDFVQLGELFNQSHNSMRDDYEVSVPEVDALVELCQKQKEVYGARLTGGGFGGSIVAITRPGQAQQVADKVCPAYKEKTRKDPTVLVPPPDEQGAKSTAATPTKTP